LRSRSAAVVCLSPFAPRKVPCYEHNLSRNERRLCFGVKEKDGKRDLGEEKRKVIFGPAPTPSFTRGESKASDREVNLWKRF
jgi:hypothetical protein